LSQRITVTDTFAESLTRYKYRLDDNTLAKSDLKQLYNAILNDTLPIGTPLGSGKYEFIIGNEFIVIFKETDYGAKFLSLVEL